MSVEIQHTLAATPNQEGKLITDKKHSTGARYPQMRIETLSTDNPTPAKRNVRADSGSKLSLYTTRFYANMAELKDDTLAQLPEGLAIDKLPSFPSAGIAHQNFNAGGTNECRPVTSDITSCLSFINSMERTQGMTMAQIKCLYWLLDMALTRQYTSLF